MVMDKYNERCQISVKLRDSCDSCAMSKVRCTKEKPSCARCRKFGHQCYYGPARRMGRPNRTYSIQPESPASPRRTRRSRSPPQVSPAIAAPLPVTETAPQQLHGHFGSLQDNHNSITSNCLDLLLGILNDLGTGRRPKSLASANSSLNASIKILSRVLICPCSQDLDIALLAAAACNSILDLVDFLVRVPSGNFSPSAGSITSTNIMGELCRVANLVVHFTSRYYGVLEGELRQTLLGVAGELKARLQSIIEEVTSEAPGGIMM